MSMRTETESVEKEVANSMSGYSQNDRPKSVKVRLSDGAGVPGYRTPVVTTYTEEEILDRLGPARTITLTRYTSTTRGTARRSSEAVRRPWAGNGHRQAEAVIGPRYRLTEGGAVASLQFCFRFQRAGLEGSDN